MTGIIRLPTDLTDNLAADADVTYTGQGDVIATAAFYQKYAASVGNFRAYRSSSSGRGGPAGVRGPGETAGR